MRITFKNAAGLELEVRYHLLLMPQRGDRVRVGRTVLTRDVAGEPVYGTEKPDWQTVDRVDWDFSDHWEAVTVWLVD